ncbi:hemerythrin [Solimonas aquatica]|uniref:Hemerythrin n=1 Tax=Solimonas aquatica TaxID=489703 RepID=A0A1H9LX28_9GAMM|nr:hemerythrin domain-containing protein [Solimonas aquatica]SER15393.1 hemerythrin [Solimonas aquatica]
MSTPSAPSAFTWTDSYKLGYDKMDETHRDFVVKVDALLRAADEDLLAHLDAFIAHAEAHFGEEAEWMNSTEFPPRQCHIDEHESVMKSLREVQALLVLADNPRRFEIARSLAQELVRWFPGHADYLDSALAQWMVKRLYGGAPVVLRRS